MEIFGNTGAKEKVCFCYFHHLNYDVLLGHVHLTAEGTRESVMLLQCGKNDHLLAHPQPPLLKPPFLLGWAPQYCTAVWRSHTKWPSWFRSFITIRSFAFSFDPWVWWSKEHGLDGGWGLPGREGESKFLYDLKMELNCLSFGSTPSLLLIFPHPTLHISCSSPSSCLHCPHKPHLPHFLYFCHIQPYFPWGCCLLIYSFLFYLKYLLFSQPGT